MGDLDAWARFQECSSQMMGPNAVEATEAYLKLTLSGWPLKTVEHDEYGETETYFDVRTIEEKAIAESEFEIPAGYEQIPFSQLFQME